MHSTRQKMNLIFMLSLLFIFRADAININDLVEEYGKKAAEFAARLEDLKQKAADVKHQQDAFLEKMGLAAPAKQPVAAPVAMAGIPAAAPAPGPTPQEEDETAAPPPPSEEEITRAGVGGKEEEAAVSGAAISGAKLKKGSTKGAKKAPQTPQTAAQAAAAAANKGGLRKTTPPAERKPPAGTGLLADIKKGKKLKKTETKVAVTTAKTQNLKLKELELDLKNAEKELSAANKARNTAKANNDGSDDAIETLGKAVTRVKNATAWVDRAKAALQAAKAGPQAPTAAPLPPRAKDTGPGGAQLGGLMGTLQEKMQSRREALSSDEDEGDEWDNNDEAAAAAAAAAATGTTAVAAEPKVETKTAAIPVVAVTGEPATATQAAAAAGTAPEVPKRIFKAPVVKPKAAEPIVTTSDDKAPEPATEAKQIAEVTKAAKEAMTQANKDEENVGKIANSLQNDAVKQAISNVIKENKKARQHNAAAQNAKDLKTAQERCDETIKTTDKVANAALTAINLAALHALVEAEKIDPRVNKHADRIKDFNNQVQALKKVYDGRYPVIAASAKTIADASVKIDEATKQISESIKGIKHIKDKISNEKDSDEAIAILNDPDNKGAASAEKYVKQAQDAEQNAEKQVKAANTAIEKAREVAAKTASPATTPKRPRLTITTDTEAASTPSTPSSIASTTTSASVMSPRTPTPLAAAPQEKAKVTPPVAPPAAAPTAAAQPAPAPVSATGTKKLTAMFEQKAGTTAEQPAPRGRAATVGGKPKTSDDKQPEAATETTKEKIDRIKAQQAAIAAKNKAAEIEKQKEDEKATAAMLKRLQKESADIAAALNARAKADQEKADATKKADANKITAAITAAQAAQKQALEDVDNVEKIDASLREKNAVLSTAIEGVIKGKNKVAEHNRAAEEAKDDLKMAQANSDQAIEAAKAVKQAALAAISLAAQHAKNLVVNANNAIKGYASNVKTLDAEVQKLSPHNPRDQTIKIASHSVQVASNEINKIAAKVGRDVTGISHLAATLDLSPQLSKVNRTAPTTSTDAIKILNDVGRNNGLFSAQAYAARAVTAEKNAKLQEQAANTAIEKARAAAGAQAAAAPIPTTGAAQPAAGRPRAGTTPTAKTEKRALSREEMRQKLETQQKAASQAKIDAANQKKKVDAAKATAQARIAAQTGMGPQPEPGSGAGAAPAAPVAPDAGTTAATDTGAAPEAPEAPPAPETGAPEEEAATPAAAAQTGPTMAEQLAERRRQKDLADEKATADKAAADAAAAAAETDEEKLKRLDDEKKAADKAVADKKAAADAQKKKDTAENAKAAAGPQATVDAAILGSIKLRKKGEPREPVRKRIAPSSSNDKDSRTARAPRASSEERLKLKIAEVERLKKMPALSKADREKAAAPFANKIDMIEMPKSDDKEAQSPFEKFYQFFFDSYFSPALASEPTGIGKDRYKLILSYTDEVVNNIKEYISRAIFEKEILDLCRAYINTFDPDREISRDNPAWVYTVYLEDIIEKAITDPKNLAPALKAKLTETAKKVVQAVNDMFYHKERDPGKNLVMCGCLTTTLKIGSYEERPIVRLPEGQEIPKDFVLYNPINYLIFETMHITLFHGWHFINKLIKLFNYKKDEVLTKLEVVVRNKELFMAGFDGVFTDIMDAVVDPSIVQRIQSHTPPYLLRGVQKDYLDKPVLLLDSKTEKLAARDVFYGKRLNYDIKLPDGTAIDTIYWNQTGEEKAPDGKWHDGTPNYENEVKDAELLYAVQYHVNRHTCYSVGLLPYDLVQVINLPNDKQIIAIELIKASTINKKEQARLEKILNGLQRVSAAAKYLMTGLLKIQENKIKTANELVTLFGGMEKNTGNLKIVLVSIDQDEWNEIIKEMSDNIACMQKMNALFTGNMQGKLRRLMSNDRLLTTKKLVVDAIFDAFKALDEKAAAGPATATAAAAAGKAAEK